MNGCPRHIGPSGEPIRNELIVLDNAVSLQKVGNRLFVVENVPAPVVAHGMQNRHTEPAGDFPRLLPHQLPAGLGYPRAVFPGFYALARPCIGKEVIQAWRERQLDNDGLHWPSPAQEPSISSQPEHGVPLPMAAPNMKPATKKALKAAHNPINPIAQLMPPAVLFP